MLLWHCKDTEGLKGSKKGSIIMKGLQKMILHFEKLETLEALPWHKCKLVQQIIVETVVTTLNQIAGKSNAPSVSKQMIFPFEWYSYHNCHIWASDNLQDSGYCFTFSESYCLVWIYHNS